MADYGGYTEDELVNIYKSLGWTDEAAIRGDIRAGHWPEKVSAATGATGTETAGFDVGTIARSVALTPEDKEKLRQLGIVDYEKLYSDIEAKALAELSDYYTKILEDVGWDIEKAKRRLEEDYQRGLRTSREDAAVKLKEYYQQTFPQEVRDALETLGQRGLLETGVTPRAVKPETITLPTGEMITTKPVTTTGFGGVAGSELERIRSSQQARREAIERALRRSEEEAGITRERGLEDISKQWERTQREKEQEKREKAASLAAERYAREIQRREAQRQEILEPYLYGYKT